VYEACTENVKRWGNSNTEVKLSDGLGVTGFGWETQIAANTYCKTRFLPERPWHHKFLEQEPMKLSFMGHKFKQSINTGSGKY
jgi:hypothetical protein